jgi:hypothetical protein
MSFGFVFILPLVLGFLTVISASDRQRRSAAYCTLAPLGTIALSLLVALLVGWEGTICLIMAAVIYAPLASVGGLVTFLVLKATQKKQVHSSVVASLLLLPVASAWVESQLELPRAHEQVNTQIEIAAPPSIIWQEIIRVRPITEPLDGFFYKMGFPKPVEATLSHEGVGGVRRASFERGLTFTETVDVWVPEQQLSFSIASAPDSVPPTTLDEHVVVGGRYFDVLRGTYRIGPGPGGGSILYLSSDIRISTRFNFYAGLWGRFLMHDIQSTILQVLKARAEQAAHSGRSERPTE